MQRKINNLSFFCINITGVLFKFKVRIYVYDVQFTYIIRFTVYVECTAYIVQCTLCAIQNTKYYVRRTMYIA